MPEGAVAVADFQTAGRGRLGRTWEAPPGSASCSSVLLKPPAGPGAAAARARRGRGRRGRARAADRLSVQIKWPNDVMLRRPEGLRDPRRGPRRRGRPRDRRQPDAERRASCPSAPGRCARRRARSSRATTCSTRCSPRSARRYEAVARRRARRGLRRPRPARLPARPDGDASNGTTGVAQLIDREGRLLIAVGHGESVAVESGEVVYER